MRYVSVEVDLTDDSKELGSNLEVRNVIAGPAFDCNMLGDNPEAERSSTKVDPAADFIVCVACAKLADSSHEVEPFLESSVLDFGVLLDDDSAGIESPIKSIVLGTHSGAENNLVEMELLIPKMSDGGTGVMGAPVKVEPALDTDVTIADSNTDNASVDVEPLISTNVLDTDTGFEVTANGVEYAVDCDVLAADFGTAADEPIIDSILLDGGLETNNVSILETKADGGITYHKEGVSLVSSVAYSFSDVENSTI